MCNQIDLTCPRPICCPLALVEHVDSLGWNGALRTPQVHDGVNIIHDVNRGLPAPVETDWLLVPLDAVKVSAISDPNTTLELDDAHPLDSSHIKG